MCLYGSSPQVQWHFRFDGMKFTRGETGLRRRLAFMPDFPLAFANASVLRHIGMVLRLLAAGQRGRLPRESSAACGRPDNL
jgi:hypothetical protein